MVLISEDFRKETYISYEKCFLGGSDSKVSVYNVGDLDSIRGSGRSPEKEMATHSVFLPRKFHGQRSLVSMGSQRVDMTDQLHFLFFNYFKQFCITIVSFFKTSIVTFLEIIFK